MPLDIPRKATRALHMARRGVLRWAAEKSTDSHIEALRKADHPLARRLADVVDRVRRRDDSSARKWASRIEAERATLMRDRRILGNLHTPAMPHDLGVSVRQACQASRRPQDALTLYLLVEALKPARALELGTNVGISSAYMAAALEGTDEGSLVTLEASAARVSVAKELHGRLDLERVDYSVGWFDDTLDGALSEPVDFAFIDGHHEYRSTLDYFERIWRDSNDNAVFVFDDIRWSRGMERAWHELRADHRLRLVVDLCGVGVAISTKTPRSDGRFVTPILAAG